MRARNTNAHTKAKSNRQMVARADRPNQMVLAHDVEATEEKDGKLRITCPECQHRTEIEKMIKHGAIRCPNCKAWILVRIKADLSRYVRGLGTTPSGNDTLDINDETATLLRGLSLDSLYMVVASNLEAMGKDSISKSMRKDFDKAGLSWNRVEIEGFLTAKYLSLNPGMQRMNLGNVLRASFKRSGQLVVV